MPNRTVLTVLVVAGIVFAIPVVDVLAQQVTNPWDPFAPRVIAPSKANSKSRPRVLPTTPEAGGRSQVRADNRPLLRPMEGVASERQGTRPGAQTFDAQQSTPEVNEEQRPAYQGRQDGPGFALRNAPSVAPSVERSDLEPVIASDGSGLPYELWRGLDLAGVEHLLAALEIPPRSQALHALWTKLITSRATLSNDPDTDRKFAALRSQALYRSGLAELSLNSDLSNSDGSDPLGLVLSSRANIVFGRPERGCSDVRRIDVNAIPDALKSETILLFGYCAAASGNTAATELAAELARENTKGNSTALAALEAVALGTPAKLPNKGLITGLTYRLLEKANQKLGPEIIDRAEPALLVALLSDKDITPEMRLKAAEAATRINAIKPKRLAEIYHQAAAQAPQRDAQISNWAVQTASASTKDKPITRAVLFDRLENEYTPFKKARLTRTFLDHARHAGLYLPALQMVHATTESLHPVPEISWFAETAIEIALASNDPVRAREWAGLSERLDQRSTGNLDHWLALLDISDPDQTTPRGANLQSVEKMALNGRFGSEQLHRLATVLDALDYNVPIPLWAAASRTPQPKGGHLPETGVLTRLADAAKNHEFGRTVLLAMQTLGPNGSEGAHMIALGDAIRALKRAGMERDARRLGFEALFASWPRVTR